MKTDLGTGYIIEGFDAGKKSLLYDRILQLGGRQNILYDGKPSEITEEIAKKCVEHYIQRCKYKNYSPDVLIEGIKLNGFNYAKQSIQSACNQTYCIIYRKK